MSASSPLVKSFLDTLDPSERETAELAILVMSAIETDLTAEDLAALIDIYAHGEVLLRDGRQVPVPDGDGMFLTQWFELMMAWAPGLGPTTVGAWRAFFWSAGDGAREQMAQRIRSLSFVQRVL